MDILTFLKDYYYLIVLALFIIILVLELLILIIKKKDPSILSAITSVIPGLVKDAELKYGAGNGDLKLDAVFRGVSDFLLRVYDIKDFSSYKAFTKAGVEAILSCPQKKGEIL